MTTKTFIWDSSHNTDPLERYLLRYSCILSICIVEYKTEPSPYNDPTLYHKSNLIAKRAIIVVKDSGTAYEALSRM
jgi:hypothetical protein